MSITFSPSNDYDKECLNVSNSNAYAILEVLGIEPYYCGSIEASELIEKIDSVTSVQSAVVEPTIEQIPGHATIIDCGRTEEYLIRRLRELRRMATNFPNQKIVWA